MPRCSERTVEVGFRPEAVIQTVAGERENGRIAQHSAARGGYTFQSVRVLPGKETYVVPAGDCLVAEMPGGGYGEKT